MAYTKAEIYSQLLAAKEELKTANELIVELRQQLASAQAMLDMAGGAYECTVCGGPVKLSEKYSAGTCQKCGAVNQVEPE